MAAQTAPSPDATTPPFAGHVLHVVDATIAARWGPMLRQTLWALAETGLHVSLITNDVPLIDALHGTEVTCHEHPYLSGWRTWRLPRQLAARFQPPPDVVHGWGIEGLSWLRRWAIEAGLGLVVHALSASAAQRLARRGAPPREHVILAAAGLAPEARPRDPSADDDRVSVIVPAVAPPVAPPRSTPAARTLAVLCVASLDAPEDCDVLLDATVQLRTRGTDLQVVIVGDGRGASAVWQRINARRINDACVVLDEPRLWEKGLEGADVCVVPARQRDLWLAPLMAQATGKLLVASRDQVADWFIEGRTCWQFTPGSAVELAYLLTRAVEQPRHVQEVVAAAAEYFNAHHTIAAQVEQLRAIYTRAARNTGDPR